MVDWDSAKITRNLKRIVSADIHASSSAQWQ
jgi:hypothetical protein